MQLFKRTGLGLVIALISLASGSAANAAVTLLTNSGQVGATYINNFESVRDSGPVTWTSGSLQSSAGASFVTTSGTQDLMSAAFPGTLEANLSSSFTTVGLFFGNDDTCCASSFDAILSVYNGATFLGSVQVSANMNDWVDQFIGLSSTEAFNRVTVSYGPNTQLYTFIDDFQLGGSAVPEPATWVMMLLGFAGIGWSLRRRNGALLTQHAQ